MVPVGTVCAWVVVLEGSVVRYRPKMFSVEAPPHRVPYDQCFGLSYDLVLYPDSFTVTDWDHSEMYKLNRQIFRRLLQLENGFFTRVLEL